LRAAFSAALSFTAFPLPYTMTCLTGLPLVRAQGIGGMRSSHGA
jgi:hypothetical protein